MSESDRELLVRAHRDVEAALASARKPWGDDAGEETLLHTAEAYLVHLRELRRNGNGSADSTPPGAAPAEPSPSCECGTVMAPVEKKNPKMPDWRCPKCDKALWNRDRKRPRTATT